MLGAMHTLYVSQLIGTATCKCSRDGGSKPESTGAVSMLYCTMLHVSRYSLFSTNTAT